MKPDSETLVTHAEDVLATSVSLRTIIKERTAEAVDKTSEGSVQIWGVVKIDGASTGVKQVAEFSLAELYGYSQSISLNFATELSALGKEVAEILSTKDDELEAELRVTRLWGRVKLLNRFIGISEFHDELITSFRQIAAQEACLSMDFDKLKCLKTVFDSLGQKVRLSDGTLNECYDTLEDAGFKLDPVF